MGTSLPASASKRAAVYIRVSTASQEDNYSLESQLEQGLAHAQAKGYSVADEHVYRDVASGFSLDRPKLAELRAALKRREFGVIIVNSFDRWASRDADLYKLFGDLRDAEAGLESVTQGPFQDTPIGRAIVMMYTLGREFWLEDHKERTRRGMLKRIESGKPRAGGKPIYGYRWLYETNSKGKPVKSKLAIHEPEAAIVRRIFRHIANGGSAAKMVGMLNAEGIPAPAQALLIDNAIAAGETPPTDKGIWCCSTVGRMICNDAYIGKAFAHKWECTQTRSQTTGKVYSKQKLKPEGDRIALPEGTIPAIVDAETAAKAQAQLKVNRGSLAKRAINPEDFLVRGGIARCGVCGAALTGAHSTGRNGETRMLYRCQAAYKNGGAKRHKAPQIEAHLLDEAVWEYVMLVRSNRDFIRQHLSDQTSEESTGADLDAVEQSIKSITRQESNLTHAISVMESPDAIAPIALQIERLAKTKRELVAEREAILERVATAERIRASLATLDARIEHEQDALEHMSYRERRDVLEALGVSVKVWPNGYAQRYEVTMAYDISAWLDPAFYVDQPEVEDEIDELTWAGLVPKTVYRGAPAVHDGTNARSRRRCSRTASATSAG